MQVESAPGELPVISGSALRFFLTFTPPNEYNISRWWLEYDPPQQYTSKKNPDSFRLYATDPAAAERLVAVLRAAAAILEVEIERYTIEEEGAKGVDRL